MLNTRGKPALLFFFETDCPTCRLAAPYLNRLFEALPPGHAAVVGISQDGERPTAAFVGDTGIRFPVEVDRDLALSRRFDPIAVPALYLLDRSGAVVESRIGFDKSDLNALAARLASAAGVEAPVVADANDGAPASKPGCTSRHREPPVDGDPVTAPTRGSEHASRLTVSDGADLAEYCFEVGFADALPVVPPTKERVERMLAATRLAPEAVIALIPPNYAPATVEKIAANAVMAGCRPELMRVLLPLIRAVCDERFNIHGIQATTHHAAPLVIVNGPVRGELGFASGGNVFSNVARANSTLGRALQLILLHLGGARPGGIDMSTLGNPGKFSYVIAENEEENPWEPLHVERGFGNGQSALTLFAGEPPRGVSEHQAREGGEVLIAVSRVLATVWNFRVCRAPEAFVVLCPEHVRTLARDGFSKTAVREFLFEHTAIPVRAYARGFGEGVAQEATYDRVLVDGEPCYRKFARPDQIHIVVAGGTAGKFSAVIGSWATGPRGSESVTYAID